MLKKPTLFILAIGSIVTPLSIHKAHSQARSAIGFEIGVNRPMTNGYAFSSTWNFKGHIKLAQKFALVPSLGVENI